MKMEPAGAVVGTESFTLRRCACSWLGAKKWSGDHLGGTRLLRCVLWVVEHLQVV